MKKISVLFILPVLLFCIASEAGEFGIKINDVSGLNTPWPIIASLPFAEGELKDPLAIRIMNKNREVPSQLDVAATWRDGSIRWALAGFTASPQGKYTVEYGDGVKRGTYPDPIKVNRQPDGGFTIDTGEAIYRFRPDGLLPEEAWLVSGNNRIKILEGSGAGAYLVDNTGRTARVTGEAAIIENRFVKEGPGRCVVKRSGWYVTGADERLAKADIWFYFAAGSPYVRVTHSLLFTQDTNKVWFRDYGLEFKTMGKPSEIYCAAGNNSEEIKKMPNSGEEIYLLQKDFPRFAERDYKAEIGSSKNGQDRVIEEIKIAGDWAHGNYGNYGITIVMPWLAERFPKEISFGERGARAVLWSGRSGKELDFRVRTLVREYFKTWVEKGIGMLKDEELEKAKSNAQGSARTHDIWFLPLQGGYSENEVRSTATACSRQVLALAEPARLCETEAMGYPMLHKNTDKFPDEEALLSEYWERFVIPLRAFPMNGYISWGCYPDRSYSEAAGKPMSQFHALSDLREYGVRREPWRLYARSGERRYYDYGHRFSRFTGDWYLAHLDVPGSPPKQKGAFITSPGGSGRAGKLPLFWGDRTHMYSINAGDIGHWLLDYYLTGDEYSFDLLQIIKESFKKNWKVGGAKQSTSILVLRTLLTLSIMDWDEDAGRMAKEVAHSLIDLQSQNGMHRNSEGKYGPMYKDHRSSHNLLEYYLETKDEAVKEAFLKLVDQRYRFDRRGTTVSYKNYDGFTHAMAYWMTGDERYSKVVVQTLNDSLYYTSLMPLSADLEKKPADPLEWPNLYSNTEFPGPRTTFFMGHHEYHNPFIGFPTALKLLSEKGRTGKTTPLVVKPMKNPRAGILFLHSRGKDTMLSIYLQTQQKDIRPKVSIYGEDSENTPAVNIKTEIEERMSIGQYFLDRPEEYPVTERFYHLYMTVPSETYSGLYLLSFSDEDTFTLLDATTEKAALFCPEGFWPVCIGDHSGEMSYGRSGEGRPAFFRVPETLGKLEIFIGRPARIRAPDGSIAVEWSNKNIGKISIPVEGRGGIWSVEFYVYSFHGLTMPCFVKLLNVETVVAFGSPELLPESSGKKLPPAVVPSLSGPLEFVSGISGKAIRISSGKTISFPAGENLPQGGYTHFPGKTGTIEFWFRPDWSTWEIPIEMNQYKDIPLLKSPHLNLFHRYWGIGHYRNIYGTVRIEFIAKGTSSSPAGFQGRHFFKAGQWTHIAYTWDIGEENGKMKGNLGVFVNGKKLLTEKFPYPVSRLEGAKKFELDDSDKEIVLGPFEGTIDMLRISDVVRYNEDFSTSKTAPEADINTRAFFSFDGNTRSISAFSKESVEAN